MLASGVAALGIAIPAFAQSSADSSENVPATAGLEATGTGSRDEIVVTATRRQEPLQKVPIAIVAASAEDLAKNGIDGTYGLTLLTPSLNIGLQGTANVAFLRGIGNANIAAGQEPSVATYVDGVYRSSPYSSAMFFNNIDRVEILKGPQGTLFGRNATGGLINIITADPKHELGGKASVSYGNYDTLKADSYVTAGVTDSLAGDLAVHFEDQGRGYGVNVFTGNRIRGARNIALRSKWLFEPSDDTQIRASASYSRAKFSTGIDRTLLPGSTGPDGLQAATAGFYDMNGDVDPVGTHREWNADLQIRRQFDNFELVSISSYSKYTARYLAEDNDGTPLPLMTIRTRFAARTATQELQLLSLPDSSVKWIAGAYFLDDDAESTPPGVGIFGALFAPLGGVMNLSKVKTRSISVFGEVTVPLLPKTRLTIGGRYTRDKKTVSGSTDYVDDGLSVVSSILFERTGKSWSEPTWRAILDHDLASNVLVYGSYSRGFKSGTFNTIPLQKEPLNPEKVDAFEIGTKAELFDRRLGVNLSAFSYSYKDIQALINQGAAQILFNAAKSRIKGIDLDGSLRLAKGFDARFGLAYLDAKYSRFPDAPCSYRDASGLTVGYTCDAGGNRLPQAPEVQFNIGASYSRSTSAGIFQLSGLYWHSSRIYWDVGNRLSQAPYGLLNGQLSWKPPISRNFTVTLYGENILGTKYTTQQIPQIGINDQYIAGTPALYGVKLSVEL